MCVCIIRNGRANVVHSLSTNGCWHYCRSLPYTRKQTELLHRALLRQTQIFFADSNMNGRVKSEGSSSSSIGEDDDIATVEETFDETSSGLANTSPELNRGSSPLNIASKSEGASPTSAAVASVQAALAALQAGQMSLNQVLN